jgi:hypothetical protein
MTGKASLHPLGQPSHIRKCSQRKGAYSSFTKETKRGAGWKELRVVFPGLEAGCVGTVQSPGRWKNSSQPQGRGARGREGQKGRKLTDPDQLPTPTNSNPKFPQLSVESRLQEKGKNVKRYVYIYIHSQ